MNSNLKKIVKLAIAAGLLTVIYRYIDVQAALELLTDVKVSYLVLSGVLMNFDRCMMAFKWSLLLEYTCSFPVIMASLTKSYYYSLLFAPFVPTTVGADVVRGVSVLKDGANKEMLVSSIIMERLLGAVSQLVLAVVALFFLSLEYSGIDSSYLYLSFFLALVLAIVILLPLLNTPERILHKAAINIPDWKIVTFAKKTYTAYRQYRNKKRALLHFFLLSLVENSFTIFVMYWLFLSMGVDVTLYAMMLTVPAALFFAKIPLTIGALGVQEGFFILFFSMVGISSEEAVMVSLMVRFVEMMAILPGCLAFYSYDTFIGSQKVSD